MMGWAGATPARRWEDRIWACGFRFGFVSWMGGWVDGLDKGWLLRSLQRHSRIMDHGSADVGEWRFLWSLWCPSTYPSLGAWEGT